MDFEILSFMFEILTTVLKLQFHKFGLHLLSTYAFPKKKIPKPIIH